EGAEKSGHPTEFIVSLGGAWRNNDIFKRAKKNLAALRHHLWLPLLAESALMHKRDFGLAGLDPGGLTERGPRSSKTETPHGALHAAFLLMSRGLQSQGRDASRRCPAPRDF
ncbi:hypothetical protein, partial [Phaeobacter sp. HF9A]|uniref:hypothetical protein n=1 Tax=Phaeobacter sp. HF9A TaxID=2721561 RepID=UPI001C375DE2